MAKFLEFEEAREIVRGFNLKNAKEWFSLNRPKNIPSAPWLYYKDKWINMYDWLGKIKTEPLSITHPYLIKEWHPTKNGDNIPQNFTHGSHHIAWWYKDECGHEWDATISSRTKGDECPYCSGHRVCNDNCVATTHSHIVQLWHPTKNGNKTLWDFTAGSEYYAWWYRDECGHEWEATICNISSGHRCPFCTGKAICSENCFSVQFPKIAAEWHPTKNGNLKPYFFATMRCKIIWIKDMNGRQEYQIELDKIAQQDVLNVKKKKCRAIIIIIGIQTGKR